VEPVRREHLLDWCNDRTAHFWDREKADHSTCPGKIGDIFCSCPHHTKSPRRIKRGPRKIP
jgi:hypothetical protein